MDPFWNLTRSEISVEKNQQAENQLILILSKNFSQC